MTNRLRITTFLGALLLCVSVAYGDVVDNMQIQMNVSEDVQLVKDESGLTRDNQLSILELSNGFVDFGSVQLDVSANVDWELNAKISDFSVVGASYDKNESDFQLEIESSSDNVVVDTKYDGSGFQSFEAVDTDENLASGAPAVDQSIILGLGSRMALGVDVPASYSITVTYTVAAAS